MRLKTALIVDLAKSLPRFHKDVKKTADPMIKMSKILLWLAQGQTPVGRLTRGIAFRTIELVEMILPTRRRSRKKLNRVLADEASEKLVSERSSLDTYHD